jgi:hypothetical protein
MIFLWIQCMAHFLLKNVVQQLVATGWNMTVWVFGLFVFGLSRQSFFMMLFLFSLVGNRSEQQIKLIFLTLYIPQIQKYHVLRFVSKSMKSAHAHWVLGKWEPFCNDIALSKWFSFTNHPMRMGRFRGFCYATQWRPRPWKRSIMENALAFMKKRQGIFNFWEKSL